MAKSDEDNRTGTEGGDSASATSGTSSADTSGKATAPKTGLSPPSAAVAQTAQAAASAAAPAGQGRASASKSTAQASDAIAMLKADHRKVEGLFSEFETADTARKDEIIEEACQDLIIHTLLEERIFYPAARQPSNDDRLDEAQVEHDAAKVLIVELLEGDSTDEYREAKFKVLAEQIKHHVKEEEASDGVFAKAQKAGVNTRELAERLTMLKQQLQQKAESGRLPDPVPASFTYFGEPSQQEMTMPRERDDNGRFMSDDDRGYRSRGRDYDDDRGGRGSSGRERDSQGRFMSDDDDRGFRSRGRDDDDRGGSRGGGSNSRERDSQGRFTSDDDGRGSRGRSYAEDRSYRSRDRDDDDRGFRGGGDGGRDRGQGGWFGDSQGHSQASRRGWDDPNHGDSGWYGDSRGHSEASRRGWDNPNHGDSGWYGDSRGHSEAARRGWDNPNHGESGWFGDSEGHSEASRRGWEDRDGGGRSSSSRRDEPRTYARGRDDDDDDRGGRRSSGGGRGGHGGWSGDSEGHAEAARRGWQNRR